MCYDVLAGKMGSTGTKATAAEEGFMCLVVTKYASRYPME
jgi:hypothetical protein